MCDATQKIFHNEDKARTFLEAQRWPDGPYCPVCGTLDGIKKAPMKSKAGKPVKGWYHCNSCRKRFTVRVGTLYERSHIPLHKWLYATHLLCASKKGISSHQLHRMLGVTYKTAWFMSHRIREGMRDDNPTPMGGSGKTVEADETYFGNVKGSRRKDVLKDGKLVKRGGGTGTRYKIVSLVERDGKARSVHVPSLTANTVRKVLVTNASRQSDLMTDESNVYPAVGREFASHGTVNHGAGEYGRGEIHTNTIEGFFSILKRGLRGVYQHCSEQHLHRYLAEYDFRYSHRSGLGVSDAERALQALKGIEGKRLT